MSLIVKEFGGFILKYVGDAVLAFFLVPSHQSQPKVACTRAINCARCMLQVAHEGINPILNRYDCPVLNVRIGIDTGENAIIQSGWDIHPNITNVEKIANNNNISKRTAPHKETSLRRFRPTNTFGDLLTATILLRVHHSILLSYNHLE